LKLSRNIKSIINNKNGHEDTCISKIDIEVADMTIFDVFIWTDISIRLYINA